MKAIIFGINGQDGFYLSELLKTLSVDVIGVSRSANQDWLQGDVKDLPFVSNLIKAHQPDFIFHFAANSTTAHHAVFENHEIISTGTLNILQAVYRNSKQSKVFLSGSAVQFENKGVPISEETAFAPLSPYAVARIQSVYAGRYYRNLGLQVYVGYFFNHDSPLRSERHVNQRIALAVQRICKGSDEKIEVGNIHVRKEFNYAGDVVNAVWRLVSQDEVHEAVIGSGKAYSIQQWIEICFDVVGKQVNGCVVEKADFIPEYNILVSDPQRIFSIGYEPQVDIRKLAEIMIKTKLWQKP